MSVRLLLKTLIIYSFCRWPLWQKWKCLFFEYIFSIYIYEGQKKSIAPLNGKPGKCSFNHQIVSSDWLHYWLTTIHCWQKHSILTWGSKKSKIKSQKKIKYKIWTNYLNFSCPGLKWGYRGCRDQLFYLGSKFCDFLRT